MKHREAKVFWEAINQRPIPPEHYPTLRGLSHRKLVQLTVVREAIVGARATEKGQLEYDRHVERELRKGRQTRESFVRRQSYLAAAVF